MNYELFTVSQQSQEKKAVETKTVFEESILCDEDINSKKSKFDTIINFG